MRAALTGIMAVKGVEDGAHDPHGHIIAKNIDAVHHQHFFSFRLDLDVDGTANRVVEMNSASMPPGPQNPQGNGFIMQETPLRTERAAQRNINLESSRRWIVRNGATTRWAPLATRYYPGRTPCRSRGRIRGSASAPGS